MRRIFAARPCGWLPRSSTAIRNGLMAISPATLASVVARLDQLSMTLTDHDSPQADLGSLVRVCDLTTGASASLMLVKPGLADPAQGRISVFSPLGAALLAARAGDVVTLRIFLCNTRFRVLKVTPPYPAIEPHMPEATVPLEVTDMR